MRGSFSYKCKTMKDPIKDRAAKAKKYLAAEKKARAMYKKYDQSKRFYNVELEDHKDLQEFQVWANESCPF